MIRSTLLCALLFVTACSSTGGAQDKGETPHAPAHLSPPTAAPSPVDAAPAAAPAPALSGHPVTTVDDPRALAVLSEGGVSFESLVGAAGWARISKDIKARVARVKAKDSKAGIGIRGNSHRLFPVHWLDRGRLELIGLTLRTERLPVDPSRCGDVRFIFRLAYETEQKGKRVHSRLPMTVLVELAGAKRVEGSCKDEAMRWMAPSELAGVELGDWLLQGPLQAHLARRELSQVLVNVQLVRWPSSVRPDLGGHAEYPMLAYAPADKGLVPKRLENMPDLGRLSKDRALKSELVAWVKEHLPGIEEGSAILPDRFLAMEAVSVTPRGLSRRANRPFRQLFDASVFEGLALDGFEHISSPEALLRRLDDMSCVGCHQSRTIAGFHWLGVDREDEAVGNALYHPRSVPLMADARRRDKQLVALASGSTPSFARPFAERSEEDQGRVGSRCGLGDPGFDHWGCAEGLRCDPYDNPSDDSVVGVCTSEGGGTVGEACEVVAIKAHRDPTRDRARGASIESCAEGVCNINRTGFPGGMCTTACGGSDDAVCGVIAQLTPFNNCLARKEPFPECLSQHVSPAGLRRCSETQPCRDDYICAKTTEGEGGCIPPYFLFQLRVDGHP